MSAIAVGTLAAMWLVLMLLLPSPLLAQSCPNFCTCDIPSNVSCYGVANMSWPELYLNLPSNVQELRIHGVAIGVIQRPPRQLSFDGLLKLFIEGCEVNAIEPGAFRAMPMLQQLHLAHNNLSSINAAHFAGLDYLEVLDVSYNEISSMHEETLRNWLHLEILDLSHNELSTLPTFPALNRLRKIDLSYNRIRYIHPNTFKDLVNIEVLDLRGNQLDMLHGATFTNVTVGKLYLSNNPWDCHCGILWLVDQLKTHVNNDDDEILCQGPLIHKNKSVINLDLTKLMCDPPSIVNVSRNQTIQYLHSALLECNVSTLASIYWLTPRGIMVHPDHRRWLPPDVTEYEHRLTYSGRPTFWEASVEALSNGSLLITNFRLYFAGHYTCVAENSNGVDTATISLEIYSILHGVMEISTLLGYSMAIGFLVAGIIIGAVRMCAERNCKCCQPPEKPPSIEEKDPMNETAIVQPYDDVFMEKHWTNVGAYQYDYDPRLRSPSLSPHMSPQKCVTPAEYGEAWDEDGLAPPHLTDDIKELLILVRASLRHGLESGTEHVRSAMRDSATVDHMRERAQTLRQSLRDTGCNLRESSSLTLQRWRSHSTQYASRARTGVAVGLEQVKVHVQSMKEMCGTGSDLSGAAPGATVSVVSMETDVDSSESKQVVKAVTML